MDINTIKTDLTKEENGVFLVYPGTDLRLKIARAGNPKFQAAQRRLAREAKQRSQDLTMPTKEQIRLFTAPAVAEFILLDWENMTEKGKPLPYNRQDAERLLSDPQLKDFYDWIMEQAVTANNFIVNEVETKSGN